MRSLLIVVFFLFFSFSPIAQKFGFIDAEFVLSQMPDYAEAQKSIDKLAKKWEGEIQEKYQEIKKLETALKIDEVLLTVDMRKERKKVINEKWKEVKAYQEKIFGIDGLYYLKKKELLKPVQDKIFEAVEMVAKQHRLEAIFDKSGEPIIIYSNPVHDYTDFVLERLDLKEEETITK